MTAWRSNASSAIRPRASWWITVPVTPRVPGGPSGRRCPGPKRRMSMAQPSSRGRGRLSAEDARWRVAGATRPTASAPVQPAVVPCQSRQRRFFLPLPPVAALGTLRRALPDGGLGVLVLLLAEEACPPQVLVVPPRRWVEVDEADQRCCVPRPMTRVARTSRKYQRTDMTPSSPEGDDAGPQEPLLHPDERLELVELPGPDVVDDDLADEEDDDRDRERPEDVREGIRCHCVSR